MHFLNILRPDTGCGFLTCLWYKHDLNKIIMLSVSFHVGLNLNRFVNVKREEESTVKLPGIIFFKGPF